MEFFETGTKFTQITNTYAKHKKICLLRFFGFRYFLSIVAKHATYVFRLCLKKKEEASKNKHFEKRQTEKESCQNIF